MSVSKECIKLLQNLVDQYGQNGKKDKDYSLLYPLLKELLFLVLQNKKDHKDERITGFLSSSALILEENPCFAQACRLFLIAYQEITHALDSMLDVELKIQPELDASWGKQLESEPNTSHKHSLFFIELQEAIARRALRMAEKESKTWEIPNLK
ncbi:Uncharacterised protein [Legionella steigerwaltii]|uniref:Uncharacterized protein n=1 Tax=Legionella steigerwaltii TaxID=460 RepID=A0A378L641_9GAMM|nr:hypothetical protein [Legionella steigerwaltii]KTD77406.1 hypothetical protein Lstg_1763 [Legionella steigerwaltii]STY22286.1 Uncharacterised protein [Legionella steigerwaltii]